MQLIHTHIIKYIQPFELSPLLNTRHAENLSLFGVNRGRLFGFFEPRPMQASISRAGIRSFLPAVRVVINLVKRLAVEGPVW